MYANVGVYTNDILETVSDKKYSLRGNISFILQKAWQMDKLLLAVAVLQIPVMVLLPLCTVYLSSFL